MILQALADYYRRKQDASPGALAPEGFERMKIPFVLVLNNEGHLLRIEETSDAQGKKAKSFLVPEAPPNKTSQTMACLLWGNAEYVLGLHCDGRKADRLEERKTAFREKIDHELADCQDEGISAVRKFLASPSLQNIPPSKELDAIKKINPFLSFSLAGDGGKLVCERDAVVAAIIGADSEVTSSIRCLITGEIDQLAITHKPIKNVWGAKSTGAKIVSFQDPAYNSYGRAQGANAPIGQKSASAYTKALNGLLLEGSKQRVQVGDASTVFWAEKADTDAEDLMALLASGSDDPAADAHKVESLFKSVDQGSYVKDDGATRFYVLGLAPNAARIAIRFWHAAPVKEFAVQIERYFRDIRIDKPSYEARPFLPLYFLLRSIALQGKAENIPPRLGGDTLRAILEGRPLPVSLLQAAVLRCRAEQKVTYPRAALIKACLNRQDLTHQNRHLEGRLTVSLDLTNKDPAYRLGRLFAIYEKAQSLAADRDLNRTIRDSYFVAAMSAPRSVFPTLVKLNSHHVQELRRDQKRRQLGHWIESLARNAVDELSGTNPFPSQFSMSDQGTFAVGYYHQTQSFYTKNFDAPIAQNTTEET